jgi:hypothetical protein
MTVNTSLAAVIVSIGGILLVALIAYCVRLNGLVRDQGMEIATLKTQMSPLWARVQAQISSDLHHPNPRYFEMDMLLEKLEALTITDGERIRLKILLNERAQDMHPDISDSQRNSAEIMSRVMDKVLAEAEEERP